ncbi:hypothetical protein [Desulfurivibrio alkaliphilus]|uniref:Uncharacterized protein n=1 Tax=Desulfurivibrio alkaliphilus (strain DSM 19089 / UNIQEM U267 / AHT2) TaxID=589865 RepID=D6Z327_DESAT|nr:hypothetical protein [Desulfurivibrio alkaliphilus]ADH85952.1 hypothetical protein DaAHT2_1256 [Desulfurivibrio alkaliphilus AHT 2]
MRLKNLSKDARRYLENHPLTKAAMDATDLSFGQLLERLSVHPGDPIYPETWAVSWFNETAENIPQILPQFIPSLQPFALLVWFHLPDSWDGTCRRDTVGQYLLKAEYSLSWKANVARQAPLNQINAARRELKDFTKELAKKEWAKDTDRTVRIKDMCKKVYPALCEHAANKNISDLVPDKEEGIKPWLRDVAPDYAKKQGRPPKKRK